MIASQKTLISSLREHIEFLENFVGSQRTLLDAYESIFSEFISIGVSDDDDDTDDGHDVDAGDGDENEFEAD